jgi:glucokinase
MTTAPTPPDHSSQPLFLGIEIGGTKLQFGVGPADGVLLEKVRLEVNREEGAAGIQAQMVKHVASLLSRHAVHAIGVGFGGPVLWRTGRVACSHHIEGWSEFPLADWLHQLSGLPVFVENDANTAALGEALLGAGKDASPVLWMNAGSGIGGGLVAGGRIYHGAAPGEVEIGHLRLDRTGTITEDLASGWSLDAQVRDSARQNACGTLARILRESGQTRGEARALPAALEAGDPDALALLNRTAETLAYALSHAIHLLNPEVVVFGGGVSLLGEPLLHRIATTLPRWLMEAFRPGPRVVAAGLGEDSVLQGALCVARQRLEAGPA